MYDHIRSNLLNGHLRMCAWGICVRACLVAACDVCACVEACVPVSNALIAVVCSCVCACVRVVTWWTSA